LRPHPRLIVDDARLSEIRALVADDAFAVRALREVTAECATLAAKPAPVFPPSGPLLFLAGDTLHLVATCGLVWRLTGDAGALDAARRHVLAICAQPPWKRDDFLAIGELAYALALAYDWLRDGLAADEREVLRRYLIDAILRQGIAAYDEGDWWVDTPINWNHECNGGLVVAALAIADSDPDIARAVIPRAIRWFGYALDGYDPDGGWDEGAGYWGRATIFSVYALAALETAVGHDAGLGARRGFAETARFFMAATGPTGLLAAYADCNERRRRGSLPLMLWMARRYDRPEYAAFELDHAREHGACAEDLFWYRPSGATPRIALDQHFRAPGSFVSMRSGNDDRDALYLWTKGGSNQTNHGHLDQGNFELDALGQRWARDLGTDNYGLPGYFDRRPGGRKWTYYRLNSLSHSVPLIDGASQEHAGTARITGFHADRLNPRAVVELSECYKPAAGLARRGVMLVQRRAALIQDEFALARHCRFTWAMTTDAAIVLDGASATLTLGGERLIATILEPAGAVFSQESAERAPPEKPNTGVRRLLVDLARVDGRLRVAVLLSPCWRDGVATPAPPIVPLGRWF